MVDEALGRNDRLIKPANSIVEHVLPGVASTQAPRLHGRSRQSLRVGEQRSRSGQGPHWLGVSARCGRLPGVARQTAACGCWRSGWTDDLACGEVDDELANLP